MPQQRDKNGELPRGLPECQGGMEAVGRPPSVLGLPLKSLGFPPGPPFEAASGKAPPSGAPETLCCEPSKPSHVPSLTWRLRSWLLWLMEHSRANVNRDHPPARQWGRQQSSRCSSPHPAATTAISPWRLSVCGGERWHFVAGGPRQETGSPV